jgi:inner membrane transporter RhtA
MDAVVSRARRLGGLPWRTPPQGLFVIGAVTQYVGSGLAVLLFARVPAAGVAWLRVLSAAVVLVAWQRPWRVLPGDGIARAARLSRLRLLVPFGLAIAAMNTTFYLAIDHLPLGTTVAIEFIGPIAVTAVGSHTRRDLGALALAGTGVLLLSDVHVSGSPLGVALALGAGVMWAAYIVLGHRVAADPALGGGRGLAVAMAIGALALAPFTASAGAKALLSPGLLAACIGVGLASSVVPYALDQVAMARLPRARFALLLALLPATATLVGLVVLGQVPGAVELVGIGLVVAATALRSHAD